MEQLGDHDPDRLYREVWRHAQGIDDADRALYGDLATYLPDQLLVKMDVSTMAHSLEARSPLLDTAVIEFSARLPNSLRLKGYSTKYLLKRLAERYLPRDLLYRRKRGFVMPIDEWLRSELKPYIERALQSSEFVGMNLIEPTFVQRMLREHMCGCQAWGQQLWTLFVLAIWAQLWSGRLHRDDPIAALL
jgi:asparagine synthase (glutamine-hydrolysing)